MTNTNGNSNSNSNDDAFANPLARSRPLGGSTGVAIVSIVPIVALVLFLLLGFLANAWAWAWVFFLAVPIAGILVYGPGGRQRN